MTDPRDPGDDWGFPEVDPPADPPVDPTSTELPAAELPEDEPVYDTGSDAWWRQQAEAQRQAAATEPVVPPTPPAAPEPVAPPELVEPEVLNLPTPLDEAWVPPELPELHPSVEPEEQPAWDDAPHDEDAWDDATTAYPAEDAAPEPEPEPVASNPDWYRGLVESTPEAVAEPMPAEAPPAVEEEPPSRAPYDGERVGPARALAGAALALAGVVLGIGAIFLLNDKGEPTGGPVVSAPPSTSASATPSATPSTSPTAVATSAPPAGVTTTPPAAEAPVVAVRVLNNSKVKGLADRAAARFRAGGWPVPQTGNYRGGTIPVTTVYYPPGQRASAERFAKQFGIPRVAPRFAGIPVPGMTVILTRDYRA